MGASFGRVGAGVVQGKRTFTPLDKINKVSDKPEAVDRRLREAALNQAREHYLMASRQFQRGLINRETLKRYEALYEAERGRPLGGV